MSLTSFSTIGHSSSTSVSSSSQQFSILSYTEASCNLCFSFSFCAQRHSVVLAGPFFPPWLLPVLLVPLSPLPPSEPWTWLATSASLSSLGTSSSWVVLEPAFGNCWQTLVERLLWDPIRCRFFRFWSIGSIGTHFVELYRIESVDELLLKVVLCVKV